METEATTNPIGLALQAIEIPPNAYEKAERRYKDVGDWLCRPESSCAKFDPTVYPQGSFLLGTVIRPVDEREEYDLDLCCKLQQGISKATHTQVEIKNLVGEELAQYRIARGISEKLDEKRRCWRLLYQDDLHFHMDIVPCIPENDSKRAFIKTAILKEGGDENLATAVANESVSITDNERDDFRILSNDWHISNPKGYGKWFQSRVILAERTIKERLLMEKKAHVDNIPTYRLKAPLQRCIQLLKRHRDVMYAKASDRQPISIIITTLAARAYQGEDEIIAALHRILDTMAQYVNTSSPRVPNPVNPEEDFADRWHTKEGQVLELEGNFNFWLSQARADFRFLAESQDIDDLIKKASTALNINLNENHLRRTLGLIGAPAVTRAPFQIETQPKPWRPL